MQGRLLIGSYRPYATLTQSPLESSAPFWAPRSTASQDSYIANELRISAESVNHGSGWNHDRFDSLDGASICIVACPKEPKFRDFKHTRQSV